MRFLRVVHRSHYNPKCLEITHGSSSKSRTSPTIIHKPKARPDHPDLRKCCILCLSFFWTRNEGPRTRSRQEQLATMGKTVMKALDDDRSKKTTLLRPSALLLLSLSLSLSVCLSVSLWEDQFVRSCVYSSASSHPPSLLPSSFSSPSSSVFLPPSLESVPSVWEFTSRHQRYHATNTAPQSHECVCVSCA